MNSSLRPSRYGKLIQQSNSSSRRRISATEELDRLVNRMDQGPNQQVDASLGLKADPVETLRAQVIDEFAPAFQELVDKYAPSGISLELDASDFLSGGRTIKMTFKHGEHRSMLEGTVTSDMVAFLETRYSPSCDGQLLRGPALRLRGLTVEKFREFVCQRLAILLKLAIKR